MNMDDDMKDNRIISKKANKWYKNAKPLITVRTSTYNRRDLLPRLFQSLEAQSFRNFEYILVDNGSAENIDDVVEAFLNETEIPMLYIKKKPGGIQEGYNCGIRNARGKFIVGIDSDDLFMPDALEIFIKEWDKIPEKEKSCYRGVIACCMDQSNNRVGVPFPHDINTMDWKKAYQIYLKSGIEHLSMDRTDLCRKYIMPEPHGMHYVETYIMWGRMDRKYKSRFCSDIVRVYYLDTEDSLIHTKLRKKTIRTLYECQWNWCYYLNHWKDYPFKIKDYIRFLLLYLTYDFVLAKKQGKHLRITDLKGAGNRIMAFILIPFGVICSFYYLKKHEIILNP